jgi:hypothetical protein
MPNRKSPNPDANRQMSMSAFNLRFPVDVRWAEIRRQWQQDRSDQQ